MILAEMRRCQYMCQRVLRRCDEVVGGLSFVSTNVFSDTILCHQFYKQQLQTWSESKIHKNCKASYLHPVSLSFMIHFPIIH